MPFGAVEVLVRDKLPLLSEGVLVRFGYLHCSRRLSTACWSIRSSGEGAVEAVAVFALQLGRPLISGDAAVVTVPRTLGTVSLSDA